jgi:hypothetical protein
VAQKIKKTRGTTPPSYRYEKIWGKGNLLNCHHESQYLFYYVGTTETALPVYNKAGSMLLSSKSIANTQYSHQHANTQSSKSAKSILPRGESILMLTQDQHQSDMQGVHSPTRTYTKVQPIGLNRQQDSMFFIARKPCASPRCTNGNLQPRDVAIQLGLSKGRAKLSPTRTKFWLSINKDHCSNAL